MSDRQFSDGEAVTIPKNNTAQRRAHVVRWYAEVSGNDYYLVTIDGEPANTSRGERIHCEHDLRHLEVGDAKAEIAQKMRGRLDDLAVLTKAADYEDPANVLKETTAEQLEALGFEREGDPLAEQAERMLSEYPLAVEATTTFEIVIGTGGPDDRILVECDRLTPENCPGYVDSVGSFEYEIRRVLYRYSWSGSAEVELAGEDKEVAEAFARRVVPELVE